MKLFSRLMRIRAVLSNHRDSAYLHGRAAQIAGGALVADGLIGLENPLDGQKSRAGIFGAIPLVGFGLVWTLLVGFMASSVEPYENGLIATGTVTQVDRQTSRDSDGNTSTTCSATVTYTVDGTQHTTGTNYSSSSICSKNGATVDVSYEPANPAGGKPLFADDAKFLKMFVYVGYGLIALGVWTFLVRGTEIAIGGWLWFWGRKQVASAPAEGTDALMAELREAWSGSEHPISGPSSTGGLPLSGFGGGTLGGIGGIVQGIQQAAQQAQQPVQPPAPAPAPTPTSPPAGWYPDPKGLAAQRWWDGTAWTEHTQ